MLYIVGMADSRPMSGVSSVTGQASVSHSVHKRLFTCRGLRLDHDPTGKKILWTLCKTEAWPVTDETPLIGLESDIPTMYNNASSTA